MSSVIVAIVISFGALIIGFMGEGGHLTALISWTPAVIVFGGTIGSLLLAFPMDQVKSINKILKAGLSYPAKDLGQIVDYFRELAIKSKRDGILSLENVVASDNTVAPFIKKGVQAMVDGGDADRIRHFLENEIDYMDSRHKVGIAIFTSAGGTAPTMGIVGTVLGLVHVLEGLATADMETLGASIASAFLATLYGLSSANLLFLPLASRLKMNHQKEMLEKELMMEGVLLLQEGAGPNQIQEKLGVFLMQKEAGEAPVSAIAKEAAAIS